MSEPEREQSHYFLVFASDDGPPRYPLTSGTYGAGHPGLPPIKMSDKPYPRNFPVRPAKWPVSPEAGSQDADTSK